MPKMTSLAAKLLLLPAVLLSSCGDDGGNGGGPGGPTASIQLVLSPASLTVQQGVSGSVTVTITRTSFTGTVTLTLDGLPAGITGAFTAAGTTADNSSLAVSVAPEVTAGDYQITVRATGTGVVARIATLALTVTPAPAIAVSASPNAITVEAGAAVAVSVTLTYTRTNYVGPITIAHVSGVPNGMIVADPTGPTTGNTGALAFAASVTTAPGSYDAVFQATGPGAAPGSVTIAITVTPPASSITLAADPVALTAAAGGGSASTTITITRSNFAGAVEFSASGSVNAVVDFSPRVVSGSSTNVSIRVDAAVPPGTYPLSFTGNGAGIAPVSVGIQLTVVTGNQVEYRFCDSDNPRFFVARDGAGPWFPVTGTPAPGVVGYRFPLAQATGGVLYVEGGGAFRDETMVVFATAAELGALGGDNCPGSPPSARTVSLPVAGVGAGQRATIWLGNGIASFTGGTSTSPITISGVRSGVLDLFGLRESVITGVPDKLLDVRGLDPASGSTLPFTADFNGATAYPPAAAQVTIGNALGDEVSQVVFFSSANGGTGRANGTLSTMPTRTWYGVPTARVLAGDLHGSFLEAEAPASATYELRTHLRYSTTVQNLTQSFGPRLPTPTAAPAGNAAYRRVRVQGVLPAEYDDLVSINYYSLASGGPEVRMLATGGYLRSIGSASAFDLTTPDVGALPGLPANTSPSGGQWEVVVQVSGWSGVGILRPTASNGATILGAEKRVALTIP